jgi:Mn-dependent DtxR family transcriptional regulator
MAMANEMPRHTRTADYLLAIETLGVDHEQVTTGLVAKAIGVSNGTASSKLKEFVKLGLVSQPLYKGACLTDSGKVIADAARHRRSLVAQFLELTLRLSGKELAHQAWAMEICLTDATLDAIKDYLRRAQEDFLSPKS